MSRVLKSSRMLAVSLSAIFLWMGIIGLAVPPAMAAEILSVRSANILQIGDQNRSYGVELACLKVADSNDHEALHWLQKQATRGTKVNLRPMGQRDGRLVAQVSVLRTGVDLGQAMVAEGLASSIPCLDEPPSP